MSIILNIAVATVFLMGISLTHLASVDVLKLKEEPIECLPLNSEDQITKKNKTEADYALPSVFLFDKS